MTSQKDVKHFLNDNQEKFKDISKFIFENPETKFAEFISSDYLAKQCEEAGFTVERNVANMETAFIATYGSGSPVIGFIGEYDALPGLNQEAFNLAYERSEKAGHACGHNLLGTGAFAAACAVKNYLQENNLPGTVKYFGCPAEEGGSGKTFMVRDGLFDGVDAALTWHPSSVNGIMSLTSLAYCQVKFKFKGTSSHAAISPELGRSALDAVEIMNVGANFLREHITSEARMHYAVTDTGGVSPNVVQDTAEVLYMIRAPKSTQVQHIYERVCKVAEGAAIMTETELSINFHNACSEYIPNRALEKILYNSLEKTETVEITEADNDFAKDVWNTLTEAEQQGYIQGMKGFGYTGDGSDLEGKYLTDFIAPYVESEEILFGSTDLSDVSWVVPTAKVTTATAAIGTALHTWQMTAQGLSDFANKGMLRAAEALALTGIRLFENEKALATVKQEFDSFRKQNPYTCPIPDGVEPKN